MPDISIDEAMTLAMQRHQAGALLEAEAIYQRVLTDNPHHAEALRMMGVMARQIGQHATAVEFLQRSLAVNPARAEAHKDLGDALAALGKPNEAVAAYRTAVQLKPNFAAAHFHLGTILSKLGQSSAAVVSLNHAIQLRPDSAQARNAMGNALWDLGQLDEAMASYTNAIQLHPAYPEANWSLGKVLAKAGRTDEAIRCFERAVELNPTNPAAYLNLGRMLVRAGHLDQARAAYEEAIRLKPDSQDWRFELSAIASDRSVSTAPASYVQRLFDDYAPTYDRHLVETLEYRVPQHLVNAVVAATPRQDLIVLDLGCGTGLCGAQFRPCARRLVGVDLSPAMIQAASERNIYDRLIQGRLETALETAAEYDLVLAGDVLGYVGDLSQLMPAVSRALRPAGLFAFSIEDYQGDGYFLHPRERFAHSIAYIRSVGKDAGLEEVSSQSIVLRKTGASETAGWIIVLTKSGDLRG